MATRQYSGKLVILIATLVFTNIVLARNALAESKLRGVVQTRSGEYLEGWIRFERESALIEKIDKAGEITEVSASDFKQANMHVVSEAKPGLRGSYFAKPNFEGHAKVRIDPVISFPFGSAGPMPGFPSDNFSVRWEGMIQIEPGGRYQFHTSSDDGVRLWVDNTKIIDQWVSQGETEHTGTIDLQGRRRFPIKLEYFLVVIVTQWLVKIEMSKLKV